MKLLLDEMLKNAAVLLRIYGVDTEYVRPRNDTELIELARAEGRVLVTRDKELYERCQAKQVQCLLIESVDSEEQIRQIVTQLGIELPFPNHTRCSICNTELEPITKEEAAGHVPPDVLARKERFWLCPKCNKAYWEGTHWENIKYIFKKITGRDTP